MLLSFIFLLLVCLLLHLVRLLVVFLLGQVGLNLAQVEQLSRELESQRKSLFQVLTVLTQLLGLPILQIRDFHLIFLLGLLKDCVPVLVELLVLLDVGLLDFLLSLLMGKHQVLELHVELLLLELKDAVLCQLSLYRRWTKQRGSDRLSE